MVKKLKDQEKLAGEKRTRLVFLLLIILYTLFLYTNTLNNGYSLDDYIIRDVNKQLAEKGISYFGEIFTTTYTTVSEAGEGITKSFGYRPVTRLAFAIEYSLVHLVDGKGSERPGFSHLVNILFYLAVVLLLYRILRRILRDYSIWFPFIITMLFIAHPVHTEVVASLKNRDELLSMLFSLSTLHLLIKYADTNKVKFLVIGLFFYIVAFLAKPTALAWWFIFPLTLYFFTGLHLKKIAIIFGLVTMMPLIGGIMPFWFLERVRDFSLVDNPLYFEDNIWIIIGTGLMSVGHYVKLLVFPHPLLYYYGYDMIPLVNLGNIWVILTLLLHLGLLAIAVLKFKQKSILSYGLLFYLVTIPMYANIVRPVPGIIGERFLLVPSVAFAILLAWIIFKLFKAIPEEKINKAGRIFAVAIFTGILLIPYSHKVISRNKDWYSQINLYRADMKYLENSVKAHDLMGTTLMMQIELELSKPVNVAKFLMPDIRRAIGHFNRATEIYPGHASSWKNLGMIYNHPRIGEHLVGEGDTAQFILFKSSAIKCFKRSLELEPGDGKALFNLGFTYENVGEMDSAVFYYRECITYNPQIVNPRSRLANLMFMQGRMDEALELNKQIMYIDPDEALPYVNFGNYYMIMGDTTRALASYEEAALRNARPEVFAFLAQYYRDNGNSMKAREYSDKYNMALQRVQ